MLEEVRADLILVVEDVRETSDGIKRLLEADGYRVSLARDELDAIESAKLRRPDLILVPGRDYPVRFSLLCVAYESGRRLGTKSRWSFGSKILMKVKRSRSVETYT
jgi:PleD family two-component response regulator